MSNAITNVPKLLPCPFCGMKEPLADGKMVICDGCGCKVAQFRWNSRVSGKDQTSATLRWEQDIENQCWRADVYRIDAIFFSVRSMHILYCDDLKLGEFDTLDEATAAAQEHAAQWRMA